MFTASLSAIGESRMDSQSTKLRTFFCVAFRYDAGPAAAAIARRGRANRRRAAHRFLGNARAPLRAGRTGRVEGEGPVTISLIITK